MQGQGMFELTPTNGFITAKEVGPDQKKVPDNFQEDPPEVTTTDDIMKFVRVQSLIRGFI